MVLSIERMRLFPRRPATRRVGGVDAKRGRRGSGAESPAIQSMFRKRGGEAMPLDRGRRADRGRLRLLGTRQVGNMARAGGFFGAMTVCLRLSSARH